MSTKQGYPVPSSFNINVPLHEPSGPSVCSEALVQYTVSSFAWDVTQQSHFLRREDISTIFMR